MAKKYLVWLDALKGLGIILVILAHMSIPDVARRVLCSFLMQLFFFISGYLFSGNFGAKWIARKIRALGVPYVFYSTLIAIVFGITGFGSFRVGMVDFAKGKGVGVTWFFICLLVTEIVGGWMASREVWKTRMRAWHRFVIIAAIAGISLLAGHCSIENFFEWKSVFVALVFWLVGHEVSGKTLDKRWIVLTLFGASLTCYQLTDVNTAKYGNGFVFYAAAFSMVFLLLYVFQNFKFDHWNILPFFGARSLEIMCFHSIVPVFCRWLIFDVGGIALTPSLKFVQRVVSLGLVILISHLVFAVRTSFHKARRGYG